jgi:hypothetical protein
MDFASTLVTTSDIQRQTKELCSINLLGPYNQEHLPAELKKEQESYERQMLYLLGQAAHLHQTKGQQLNESILRWQAATYFHHPSDLVGDPEWENYYPAIVLADKPFQSFTEAVAAEEPDQRFLTTQLLSGNLPKKRRERLLHRAQSLVCSLDPRDTDFFNEATLSECLQQENLATNKEINSTLGRKSYTPVTKADRREALARQWEERNARLTLRWKFDSGQWDAFELEAVQAFTYEVMHAITTAAPGYVGPEFLVACWDVLREAEERDFIDNYYLDPREEYTWKGLADFAKALHESDTDAMHYDYQEGKYTAQQWMRNIGLSTIYGDQADWWEELTDLVAENNSIGRSEYLLATTNRSPREEVELYRVLCTDRLRDSNISSLVKGKYSQQIKEVLNNA